MTFRFSHVLPLLAGFLCLMPALAQDRELTTYNELLQITKLDKIYAMPLHERDLVQVQGSLVPNNKSIKPQEVVLTVVTGAEKIRLPVNADGSFDLVPDAKLIKSNPMVLTSLPAGEKSGFSFVARPLLGEGLRFQYANLMGSVKQMNSLMKANSGMMSFFVPKFIGVELQFSKPAQQVVQILSKSGTKNLPADSKGALQLKIDEALLLENPQIVLSERPQSVDFVTK